MNKILRVAVSIGLLAIVAWKTDWVQVGQAFAHMRVELWLASVGLFILTQVASSRRWQLFARELRFERSVWQLFRYYLVGMYFNLSLPSSVGGDVVRAWYLDGGSGRRLAAFAATFLERLNGLLVLILLACVATALSPEPLPFWIPCSVWGSGAVAALGLALLPLLARWRILPAQRRQQLQSVVQALHAPGTLAQATLLSVLVQVGSVISVWFVGMALEAPIPLPYYFIFVPMVSLLTLLPSINGTGVREFSMCLFLAHLPGVGESTALTLSILWFLSGVAVSLLGGVVYLLGSFPKPGVPNGSSNEGSDEHGRVDRDSDQGREGQLEQAA